MFKKVIIVIIIVACIGLAWLVWPTLYRYDKITGKFPMIKTNRITGETYGLSRDGWKKLDGVTNVATTVEAPSAPSAEEKIQPDDGFVDITDQIKTEEGTISLSESLKKQKGK